MSTVMMLALAAFLFPFCHFSFLAKTVISMLKPSVHTHINKTSLFYFYIKKNQILVEDADACLRLLPLPGIKKFKKKKSSRYRADAGFYSRDGLAKNR